MKRRLLSIVFAFCMMFIYNTSFENNAVLAYENIIVQVNQIKSYLDQGLYLEARDLCSLVLRTCDISPEDISLLNGYKNYAIKMYNNYLATQNQNNYYSATHFVCNCSENISLRDEPYSWANVITEIPIYSGVTFISDEGNNFYKVYYRGQIGYVNRFYLGSYEYDLEPQIATYKAKVSYCNSYITMRTGANTSAREIMKLPLGAIVYETCVTKGNFRLVDYNGTLGWVLDQYLQILYY